MPPSFQSTDEDKEAVRLGSAFSYTPQTSFSRKTTPDALVSVIIPTFNRAEHTCRCIASVLEQDWSSVEIIVIDDHSTDDTPKAIATRYPQQVRLIRAPRRLGPAHLRNIGIRAAAGDFLLFLDSDIVLQRPELIRNQVKRLQNDPTLGQVGGEIPVHLGMSDRARGKRLDRLGNNHPVVSTPSDGGRLCDYLATCNVMVSRQTAWDVGGFDPYFIFGGEDVDFGWRIRRRLGRRNLVDFRLSAHHHHAVTGRYPDETMRYHLTRVRFNLKHFEPLHNVCLLWIDGFRAWFFYGVLLPKLAIKRMRNEPIVPDNLLGGWNLIRAYLPNIRRYGRIRNSRITDFLAPEEMRRYEQWIERTSEAHAT